MERDLWSREDYGSGSGGGRPFSRDPTGLLKNTYGGEIFDDDEHVVDDADEVDDFLDRDKLVFNICSNKSNAFDKTWTGRRPG